MNDERSGDPQIPLTSPFYCLPFLEKVLEVFFVHSHEPSRSDTKLLGTRVWHIAVFFG